jgi:glutathione peroxidase
MDKMGLFVHSATQALYLVPIVLHKAMIRQDLFLPLSGARASQRRRLLGAALAWPLSALAAPATATACPPLLAHTFLRLQDEKPVPLCQFAGQVLLVVNTASLCGFTGQYSGLEALDRRWRARGLAVIGFPSNDFGRQEPGSAQQIADFCENTFGVRFPMMSKTTVVGRDAHPFFRALAQRTGSAPQWNFHKYLIARDGQTVRSYPSAVAPDNPQLLKDIEQALLVKS